MKEVIERGRNGKKYLPIRIILDAFLLYLAHQISGFFSDDFVVFL